MKKMLVLVLAICMVFSVAVAQAESVKAIWDANSEADLAGYKLHYGLVSGDYETSIDVGLVIEHIIDVGSWGDGLYYFAVTAYDNAGNESGYSNEATYSVDHTAPADPTGCSVIRIP